MKTKFNGILTLLLAFVVQISFAQEKTISGTVSDNSGSLPGVSILVKGSSKGTETDFNGKYTIKAKAGDVLVFRYLGFKTSEKTVGASITINVKMEEDANVLDEVVVQVAYGERKRKDIIGAVSVVTAEEIGDQRVTTVTEALQGTAGLSLVNTSGQPGSTPTIRIRGIGSLSGNIDPLIIIDGSQFTGNLNAINFNDVESYSVLKDADATSLYGNRGANGVIIITTKKGTSGGNDVISIETSFGFSDKATKDYSYLDAEQIFKTSWIADRNDRVTAGTPFAEAGSLASAGLVNLLKANPYSIAQPIDANGNLASGASLLYETDLTDLLTQVATRQDVALSVTGGTDKSNYFLSGSFLDSDGYTLLSKFKRYTGRLNITSNLKDWLTVGANSSVTFSTSNVPIQAGSRFSNNVQYIRSVSSIYPIYQRNADGSFILDGSGEKQYDFAENRGFFGNYNPLADTYGNQNKYERSTVVISPYVELNFSDDLKFKSQFNYTNYLFEGNVFSNLFTGTEQEQIDGRSSQKERSTTKSWNVFNTLSYKKTFNEVHNINTLIGQEAFDNKYNFLRTTNTGFVFPALDELDNGNGATEARSYTEQSRLFSLFGRLDYNYNEIYYFGASIRRDGSSRFVGDNRFGTFWSVAGAVSIADQFFKDSDVVNNLKLRASYGTVGNQNLGSAGLFPTISEYGTGYNQLSTGGVFLTTLGNTNLKWEEHEKLNIGLDFGFLNNKINGSVEYYSNKVNDLIYFFSREPSVGSGGDGSADLAGWENLGALTNEGFELTVNSTNIQTQDFRWTTSLSLSNNKSRIVTIPDPNVTGSFRWEDGRDRYEFYMREWAGVDPGTGAPLWYKEITDPTTGDVTGKETTSVYADATRIYTGKSALPDVEGRFASNFKYKNFDLGLNFNFKFGHYINNTDYASLMKARNPGEQLSTGVLSAWQNPGDLTEVPKLTLGDDDFGSASTRWLQQGDFIRLRNVALGYSLDDSMIKKFNLKGLRVYLSADNYWTWSKEDNLDDPEQSFEGTTDNSSTILKTITLGLNLSF
ncbi:TonB-dependent receptor [uncultured Polaribacter sp.]|uniref:SusC/RagA family TonB-linked outer membrane protein n=1 Tax=uncultured Polaribacter sp. TaxID=174711 RepID=UPI0030DBE6B6|tara:strand:- start:3036 stop:6158 length:3123 start_codon:yes stop_codon:yes gene_type:complete